MTCGRFFQRHVAPIMSGSLCCHQTALFINHVAIPTFHSAAVIFELAAQKSYSALRNSALFFRRRDSIDAHFSEDWNTHNARGNCRKRNGPNMPLWMHIWPVTRLVEYVLWHSKTEVAWFVVLHICRHRCRQWAPKLLKRKDQPYALWPGHDFQVHCAWPNSQTVSSPW